MGLLPGGQQVKRFIVEDHPDAEADPFVLLVVAAIKAMNKRQRNELAQQLDRAEMEEEK